MRDWKMIVVEKWGGEDRLNIVGIDWRGFQNVEEPKEIANHDGGKMAVDLRL